MKVLYKATKFVPDEKSVSKKTGFLSLSIMATVLMDWFYTVDAQYTYLRQATS